MNKIRLLVDPDRAAYHAKNPEGACGIYVRAFDAHGVVGNHDIVELTTESLLEWLRNCKDPQLSAETLILLLLGHQPQL